VNIDSIVLARMQFAATASFHIIFPCLIIGLSSYLLALEILWLKTGRRIYRQQFEFWIRPFAAFFITGVITGIVLSYQLDTIFGGFYERTVDVLVPIRQLEFANAVLLEAGCFGIMVWGWRRVGDRLHVIATSIVTLGVYVSVFCILSRNSWMQTPAGHVFIDGTLGLDNALAAVFNPSFPYRFVHMVGAAWLSSAFFIMGISSTLLLHRPGHSLARQSLRVAVITAAVLLPLQILTGDLHGLNTRDHQPMKLAAMEGLWQTTEGAPLVPLALPDPVTEQNRYAVEIPRLASLIITHDLAGVVLGLNEVPASDRPNVPIVFASFRIMVALGMLMLVVAMTGLYLLRRKQLFETRWFLRVLCWMTPSGFLATIAGWCVTEAGRQPWVVYGLVRTTEVVDTVARHRVPGMLVLIGISYVVLLVALTLYLRRVFASPVRGRRHDAVAF